jgi:hypothetical protein
VGTIIYLRSSEQNAIMVLDPPEQVEEQWIAARSGPNPPPMKLTQRHGNRPVCVNPDAVVYWAERADD